MKTAVALMLVDIALVATPLFVANPLLTQTPAILAFAHASKTLALVMSVALATFFAIRLGRKWSWSVAAMIVVSVACVAITRMNTLEWIFAPARDAAIAGIASFHDIRDTDMVIGVAIAGESRAYPVRYLAYHHMLNDQLGGTALLPTY